jgi:hypothetical protein
MGGLAMMSDDEIEVRRIWAAQFVDTPEYHRGLRRRALNGTLDPSVRETLRRLGIELPMPRLWDEPNDDDS